MAGLVLTDRCTRELDRLIGRIVSLISVNVTNNVVVSTPVDTGFAKASWIPSVGKPTSSKGGSRAGPSRGAQSAGLSRLEGYKVGQGRVFIVNNVEYIGDLNSGSSIQAPAGFVQGGIVRGVSAAIKAAPTVVVRR